MKAVNAGQALALCLVDEFVRCGLTDACLAPGSRSTPMALALAEHPRVKSHVVIDERSAAFLALGLAKESGRPSVVLTTSGTAAANLLPAAVEASYSAAPLLVLTADRPPELRDTGAGQTIDQIKLFGGFVRWGAEVGVAEPRATHVRYWRSLACRAWAESLSGPPGPVHLNLAFRDPLAAVPDEAGFESELEGRPDGRPWSESAVCRRAVSSEDLSRLAGEIEQAQRGLIVVGTAGDTAAAAAVELAARTGWPLLAEATSNARQGPAAVSTYDALLRHRPFAQAHRPDLVLRVGSLGLSPSLNELLDHSVRQIVLHDAPFTPDPRRGASWVIRADPAGVCEGLAAPGCLGVSDPVAAGGWLEGWLEAEKVARSAIDNFLDASAEVTEPGTARDLAAALPEGSSLVVASSMPVRDLDWSMGPRRGLRILANRGANGIDGFVSTALGVALSAPGPTTALGGDLSLLHDQNGLIYASKDPVDAVFVVVNNNGGGIFSFLPQAEDQAHFERLFGTPHDLDLQSLAGAYRLGHVAIDKPSDLRDALTSARQKGGTNIVEVRTDRIKNVEIHRALWQSVADALALNH